MNKILRYSFIALLAFICNVSFADTVVTFTAGTENGQYTGSGKPSSGAESITKDGVTIGTTNGAFNATNYDTKASEYRIYKSQTFTASVDKGTIKKIVFTCTAKGTAKQGPGCFTGTGYTFEEDGYIGTWAGNAASVSLTTPNNQVRATKIEVTIDPAGQGGGTDPTPDPDPVQTVDNIAAFKALESGTTANLKLTNAVVLYKNEYTSKSGTNTEFYVRDATGAIQFFNTGLNLSAGQLLNGTVEVTYTLFADNGMPEATKSTNTSEEKLTTADADDITPTEVSVADLTTDKYLCDWVKVKDVELTQETTTSGTKTYTNNYMVSGEDKVMIYDKFKKNITLPTSGTYTIEGILVSAKLSGKIVNELAPTSEPVSTGIKNITADDATLNAPAYNLAGQKVSSSYKGVVVKAGKKFVQK